MNCLARTLILAVILLLATAFAFAQGNGATPSAPPGSPSWVKWIVDLGTAGILLGVLIKLWTFFQSKDKEHQEEKAAWAQEKEAIKLKCQEDRERLVAEHEREKDRIWEEARRDKGSLRTAFEAEKKQMREIYTTEIKALQEKYEKALREQNEITREVMNTAQAMATSLEQNTRVVEKFDERLRNT